MTEVSKPFEWCLQRAIALKDCIDMEGVKGEVTVLATYLCRLERTNKTARTADGPTCFK